MEKMEKVTLEVLDKNKPLLGKDEEVAIWQVVSRGVRSSGGERVTGGATVAVYCVSVNFKEFARHYVEGARLVIPSTRRIPPQCLESKAKITNKMNHNIAIFEARQVDPQAIPLMLDIHGNLSESNAHNLFLVLNNNLCTPADKNVLGGVTKDILISIAQENKIKVVEGDFTPYDLYNADEAFFIQYESDDSADPKRQQCENRQTSAWTCHETVDKSMEPNGRRRHCRSSFGTSCAR